MADGNSRSSRLVSLLAVAGFVLLLVALSTWAYATWTKSWVATVWETPDQELEAPLPLGNGARATATFVPGARIPHLLVVWVDTGFPSGDDGPCPISLSWSVEVDGRVLAEGDGADLSWRAGHPGQGTVWLGRVDAVRDAEHVVSTHVVRGLPAATARIELLRDDLFAADASIRAKFLTRLAWAPFALGTFLLLLSWFGHRYRIRRRP